MPVEQPASPPLADAPAPRAPSLLPGGPARWEPVWADEFESGDAELDRDWKSQNGPSGHILSSRWRENAVLTNGTLRLVNRKQQRGGQAWTSGSVWTHQAYQYGYFECRYRYAAAEGCNNSFWLMPTTKVPAGQKHFEIDINEGHYPN
jgi:beta-glucanase (GH16 family)